MLARSFRSRGAAALGTLAMAACASTASTPSRDYAAPSRFSALTPTSRVVDAERIRRSGAITAWDAVRMLVPRRYLDAARGASLRSLGVPGTDGLASIRLIVDGHRMDMEALRSIPATQIVTIHVLTASEAAIYFGSGSGARAIVIQTFTSLRSR